MVKANRCGETKISPFRSFGFQSSFLKVLKPVIGTLAAKTHFVRIAAIGPEHSEHPLSARGVNWSCLLRAGSSHC